jgi:hypothetical protein
MAEQTNTDIAVREANPLGKLFASYNIPEFDDLDFAAAAHDGNFE